MNGKHVHYDIIIVIFQTSSCLLYKLCLRFPPNCCIIVNNKPEFISVDKLLNDKQALEKQLAKSQKIITNFKTDRSSEIANSVINNYF